MIRPSQRHFAPENLDPRLRAGLVGHWVGGGSGNTWFDRSGYGNHAAISGASWAVGEGGKRDALEFDGTDSCTIGASPSLNVSAALTVALWFKRRGSAPGSYHPLVQRFGGATTGFQMYSNNPSSFSFYTNAVVNSGALIPDGWSHLAVTNDGATTRFYIDGRQVASAAQTLVDVPTATTATIGRFTTNYANALIDDVRIYNRALSAAEIAILGQPSFLPVVPRRWFVGAGASAITTDATAASAIWVALAATARLRLTTQATAAFSTWTAPAATARTRYTVAASAALSAWVAPSASAQIARRRSIPISGSRASYAITGSRASYHIEGS